MWVIGIDGGATATRAALANEKGEIVARATAGSISPFLREPEEIERGLRHLVDDLLKHVSSSPSEVRGVCLGISGCDQPADRKLLESIGRGLLPHAHVVATNDALIALVGGCGNLNGIAVISGTGSIAYGYLPDGRWARAGGHGHWLGDEGSGFAIALQGLIAVLRAHDKRSPETILTESLLNHLRLADPTQIKGWMRSHGADKATVAALAPLVIGAAQEGDFPAQQIVEEAAKELALAVKAVAQRLWGPSEPVDVVVAGSNLRKQPLLYQLFREQMAARWSPANVMQPRSEADQGACTYVLQLLAGIATLPEE